MYVIMICMVIVFSTMILLTYGTINESSFAMGFSMFLLVVALLLEFIGAIVILVYGVEESDILIKDLKEVFFKLIYRMDYDERANRILKIVQEYVRSFFHYKSFHFKWYQFTHSANKWEFYNLSKIFRENIYVLTL